MARECTQQVRMGRVLSLAIWAIGVGMLFPACSSSGLAKGSADASSHFDGTTGGASGSGGITSSDGSTSAGGTTSSGATGGSTPTGGATGATGGTTSSPPNCAMVGCSEPPLCSVGCTAPCGCCACGLGERRGDLICTKSGCYASAVTPDAGFDQAIDAPQADAPRAEAGGSGGTTGTGGSARTGGATATGGTTGSSAADAGLDGRVGADAAANSCENPLPLRCGDRLNHNTLIQGRPNVWSGYACTQRWMSGPEAIYFLQPPAGCQAVVQLKNHSADLYVFVVPGCGVMSSCNFALEAGPPSFVVVDGYNGAWGTYTLQVDCTCNQDAGTSDAPVADAQGGTAIAPGCDLDVAWKAIAAAGLTSMGFPQTLNDTLPATLATDTNWGLKATVCQEGGYDITPLAGKPICLLEQDITQRCQGNPASVSVLMNNGAVACIYKTVRKGFGATPGVYSATDPNCTQPTLAAATSVFCGNTSCGGTTAPCCPALTSINTNATCDLRCPVPITCDGPEDCSNGSVCCSLESAAGFAGASCVNASECVAPSRLICHQQADCPSPQQCAVPNPMPAYIPEDYSPSLPPYLWTVSYKACAP